MGRMIALLVVLAVTTVESLNSGLRVKFNVGLRPGRDFFFDVPRHVDDAFAKKWTPLQRPASPLSALVMYCPNELVICALFDPVTSFIAGVQIALPLNEFTGAKFDWSTQGFISWTPPVTPGTPSVTFMTKQLYFISEETLLKSPEERRQAALANEVLQENSVWPMGFNQQLIEVPRDVDGIVDLGFTKQACIPWMGQHYYYKMSAETQCTADSMLNWFPLLHDNKLIGMGFVTFGALEEKSGQRFYFERPPRLAVQAIVPRGPQCLYQLAQDPTMTTMHIYFVDKPWEIFCPLFP